MAILDQSTYNEMIARSITDTGPTTLNQLTGGTLSRSQVTSIENLIEIELDNSEYRTTGVVPESVINSVAKEIYPHTPIANMPALETVLRASNLFGFSGPISASQVGSADLAKSLNLFTGKQDLIDGSFDLFESSNMTSGFVNNIRNKIGNNNTSILTNAVRGMFNSNGDQVMIDRTTTTAINAMVSQNTAVYFKSFPPAMQVPIRQAINDSLFGVVSSGMATKIDGRKIAATPTSLAVDFSKANPHVISQVAAESIIVQTGAVWTNPNTGKKEVADATELAEKIVKDFKTIADQIPIYTPEEFEISPRVLGEDVNFEAGQNFISSVEELEYEMSSMTREISEIIVHWSETYTDANLTAKQLKELTGAGDEEYHLIIKRDGSLQRGVPMNTVGNHCEINGHNHYSIGICFVGGVNVASGDENVEFITASSITRTQYNTFYQICRTFFNQYPGGQALGHMDVDITQDDPGFDVRNYVYNNFNKTSLYKDPLHDPAFSPADILAALEGEGPIVLVKDPDMMDKLF